jgi:hypothetical protein
MFVCCECCVLSGRGLWDELITRPEESYRLWCVVVCDLETSRMRWPWPALGRSTTDKKIRFYNKYNTFNIVKASDLIFVAWGTWLDILHARKIIFKGQRPFWKKGMDEHPL